MANIKYTISPGNIHLIDSYLYPKKQFERHLNRIWGLHPSCEVWNRSRKSLKREWGVHNVLYSLGIARARTKDCDLNYQQRWYVSLGYAVLGFILWPFVK